MSKSSYLYLLPLILLLVACNGDNTSDPNLSPDYAQAMETHVLQDSARHITNHETIRQALLTFYEERNYRIAWVDEDEPHARADTLMEILELAEADGPSYSSYDLDRLRLQMNQTYDSNVQPETLAELDAEFTYAYLRHALDLHSGRVDPTEINPAWETGAEEINLARHLQNALDDNRIRDSLRDIAPQHDAYLALREAMGTYRQIQEQGGWPQVPDGSELARGDSSSDIPVLRERLQITGDLSDRSSTESTSFDDELAESLANFQKRHGLEIDSTLNDDTREALNVPVGERLNLIEMNIERWHWLPTSLGERYVLVNLPAYELQIHDEGTLVDEMAVVIGEEYDDRATPTFIDEMEHLIFSPYWNVPESIAEDEILPEARDDIGYLAANNYEIVESYGPGGQTYEPSQDLLDQVEAGELFLREKPGPENALGRVKFMFPNEHAIYLHDTPEDHLFDHEARGYSHGCVRVERPADLAEFVLQENEDWDRQRIESAMNDGDWEQVMLDEQVPVYLLYWTAYADTDSGQVHFNEDVYNHDEDLAEALQ